MKTCNVQYDKHNNTIKFDCKSSEIIPSYLHYLLLFYQLPETATIIFTDKSIKLVHKDQKYKYERI